MSVASSFGIEAELEQLSNGRALVSIEFSHWQIIQESPFVAGKAMNIMKKIRNRVGLKEMPPTIDAYLDKL